MVARILRHSVAAGEDQLKFQIKWPDPTWTTRTHVPEEVVSHYFRRLREGKDPTKRRRSKRLTRQLTRGVST